MAFFKFRQRGQPQPEPAGRGRGRGKEAAAAGPQDSIDSMRRRARHRLVGAAVLVLLAIIGFPLLFDTQPRPVAVNAPITIPDKDQVAPLTIPEPVSADASLDEREEVVTSGPAARDSKPAAAPLAPPARSQPPAAARDPKPDTKPDTAAEALAKADAAAKAKADEAARAQAQAEARAKREEEARAQRDEERAKAAQARRDEEQARAQAQARREQDARAKEQQEARAKREAEQRAKREEAARARALLEGRSPAAAQPAAAATQGGRFIVQVGAFADDAAVREARQKAERAGVRTYTQVVNTKDGKRTRVRVGPFGSREEADKAAATLKKAGLAGAVLAL